jgi:hypothetical protein
MCFHLETWSCGKHTSQGYHYTAWRHPKQEDYISAEGGATYLLKAIFCCHSEQNNTKFQDSNTLNVRTTRYNWYSVENVRQYEINFRTL